LGGGVRNYEGGLRSLDVFSTLLVKICGSPWWLTYFGSEWLPVIFLLQFLKEVDLTPAKKIQTIPTIPVWNFPVLFAKIESSLFQF